ncbi:hypothetical protein [Staphylococcus shinii]|uniref:hypothetical protein n=1 Tax=Staphylococcus shinii TaxID=2912228 RepID=UPI003F548ED7
MSKRVEEIKSFFKPQYGEYGIDTKATYYLHFEKLQNEDEYDAYFVNYNMIVGMDEQTIYHELSLRVKKIVIDDNNISDKKIVEKIASRSDRIHDIGTVTYTNQSDIKKAIKKLKGNISPKIVFNQNE